MFRAYYASMTPSVGVRLQRNWWRLLLIAPVIAMTVHPMKAHPWLILLDVLLVLLFGFQDFERRKVW
jgi:hypothetical protein